MVFWVWFITMVVLANNWFYERKHRKPKIKTVDLTGHTFIGKK